MTKSDNAIQEFLAQESAGGILLMVAAFIAIIFANTPLSTYYDLLLSVPIAVKIGTFGIDKPLLLWINDGLMAVFFLLVGLELKRELLEGELSDPRQIVLPAVGAIGGMAVPAAIYSLINSDDPVALQGWAIPAATDIAFALGVLSILGKRVPLSLKIFLTSLAIFDDVGAILIIAILYTSNLSLTALIVALVSLIPLTILNRKGVTEKSPYILIGLIIWIALLKSGVHATLAGIIVAAFIPLKASNGEKSPLRSLEHDLHGVVAFFVLPVFAFANAGIPLLGLSTEQLLHPIPVGIASGLFIGKQVGIFFLCWLAIKSGIASLPKGMTWTSLYATSALCGIGFTMSLFIGSLAFEETGVNLLFDERLGIILGSLLSGLVGYVVLNRSLPKTP